MMKRRLLIVAVCVLSLAVAVPVIAQSGYGLDWFTVDGGGGVSAGGAYSLGGTIGQADAGELSGGSYALTGGFWGEAFGIPVTGGYPLYLPLITRNP